MSASDRAKNKKGKKSGGILGAVKKIGGGAINLLTAPQQIVYGLGSAIGDAAEGDFKSAGHGLTHAAGELVTLGQKRDDWDFAQAVGHTDESGVRQQAKLPKGLNTTAGFVVDPLLFTGVGKGREAAKGVKALSALSGQTPEAISAAIKTGAVDLGKGSAQRTQLVQALTAAGAKPSRAEKVAKLTARRGAGGVNVFVPGTELHKNILSGAKMGRGGKAIKGGIVAGLSATKTGKKAVEGVSNTVRHAFDPNAETADMFVSMGYTAEEARQKAAAIRGTLSGRQAKITAKVDEAISEVFNAVNESRTAMGRDLTDDDLALALRALEGADIPAGTVDPGMLPLINTIARIRTTETGRQVAAGVLGFDNTANAAKAAEKAAKAEAKAAAQADATKVANDLAKEAAKAARAELAKVMAKTADTALARAAKQKAVAAAKAAVKAADDEIERLRKVAADEMKPAILKDIEDAGLIRYDSDITEWDPSMDGAFLDELGPSAVDDLQRVPGTVEITGTPDGYEVFAIHWDDAGNPSGVAAVLHNDPTNSGTLIPSEIVVAVRPDSRGKGIATRLYQKLDEAGYNTTELSGKGGYAPDGAAFAAARRAKAAAAVIDVSTKNSAKLARAAEKAQAAAEKAGAKADTTVEELNALKKAAADAKKAADKAKSALRKEKVKLAKLSREAKLAAKKAEKQTPGLKGVRDDSTYMERILTEEAEAVRRQGGKPGAAMSDAAGSLRGSLNQGAAKARTLFPEMPVSDMNMLLEAHHKGHDIAAMLADPSLSKYVQGADEEVVKQMIAEFKAVADKMPPGSKLYVENPLTSLFHRVSSAERAIEAAGSVADIRAMKNPAGEQLLLSAEDVANGMPVPHGYEKFELPHLGEHHAPPALIKELQKVAGVVGQSDFMSKFDKAMEGWTRFWKTHATTGLLGSIPFAARNGRSNVYLMMTEGFQPQEISKAMKEMWDLETKVRKITGQRRVGTKFVGEHSGEVVARGLDDVLRSELTKHEYDMLKAMQEQGVLTRGFFDMDFADTAADKAELALGRTPHVKGGIVGHVLSPRGAVARRGRDINQAVEHNARMALFSLAYEKYGTFDEAAQIVKKTLFDYSELTEFEQKVMKNIVPFYTFMRKNLPLQLETLIQNPMRVALPEKVSTALSPGLPEGAPDYQEEAGSRAVNPLVPLFGGMISTPDRPFNAAMETVSPLILAARGQGKEAVSGLANLPGGPQIGLLKALTEISTGKDTFTRGNVKPGAAEAARRLLLSQLPSLQRLPRRVGPIQPLAGPLDKSGESKPTSAEALKLLLGLNRLTETQK